MGYTLYILRQYNILNLKVSAKRCVSKLKVGAKKCNFVKKVVAKRWNTQQRVYFLIKNMLLIDK